MVEAEPVAPSADLEGTQRGPIYEAAEFRREMRETRLELCAQMRDMRLELCAQMRADTRILVLNQIAMSILVMITIVRFA